MTTLCTSRGWFCCKYDIVTKMAKNVNTLMTSFKTYPKITAHFEKSKKKRWKSKQFCPVHFFSIYSNSCGTARPRWTFLCRGSLRNVRNPIVFWPNLASAQLVLVINIEIHGIIYQYFTQFNVMREPQFLFASDQTSCTHIHTSTWTLSLLHTLRFDTSK